MLTLTPKQTVAWNDHLDRSELRRHLFYGGARSGKTDVILAWLCVQASKYPGARILVVCRTRIAAILAIIACLSMPPAHHSGFATVGRPCRLIQLAFRIAPCYIQNRCERASGLIPGKAS